LTWPDETDPNNVIYRRWRYFLKPRSYLPFKVEKYSRGDPDSSYVLEETLVISYPGTDQICELLEGAAGHDHNYVRIAAD
jgi:hypothetical protein